MNRKRNPLVLLLSLLLLWPFLQGGLSQESSQSEEKKIEPLSEWSKQWLEEVVSYIITDIEKSIFKNLPTEMERGKFIENFWKKRDPDPNTPENEFKIDYYKRIALANKFFGSSGIAGWRTDRGKIYILLGPPNEIQRDMAPSGSSFYGFHGPKEVWNYWGFPNPRLPYNMEFVFIDKLGTGNYVMERSVKLGDAGASPLNISSMHYHFDYMEFMAEAMRNPFEGLDRLKGIVTTQTTYDRISLDYDLYYLKGSEEKTYIPSAIKIPYSAVTQKKIENEYYFDLTLLINVSNNLGQIVYERSKSINFKHSPTEMDSLKDKTFQIQIPLSLEPKDYKIHFLVLDNFSGKVGTLHKELSVPKFSGEELSTSDIILSSKKKTKRKEVRLTEEKMFKAVKQIFQPGEEMNVFFEVYNLSLNPSTGMNDFKAEYFFLQNGKLLTHVPSPATEPTAEKDCRIQTSFRLKNFKPGKYVLGVKVIDLNSGKETTKEIQFIVTH